VRFSSGSEPIREADEVAFVDSIEHHDGRALDDLILERGDSTRLAAGKARKRSGCPEGFPLSS
jgi:hypothetical protein